MDAKSFSIRHDTILVYRTSGAFAVNRLVATDPGAHYNKIDDQGRRYYINPLRSRGGDASRADRPSLYFPLTAPDGSQVYPRLPDGTDGRWRWSHERVERDVHLIEWIHGRAGWTPWYRTVMPTERFRPPETIWRHEEVGSTRTSSYEIKALFGGLAFSTPKPERLMERIIHIGSNPGDIVLDCFVGSGTTAAVAHKMGRRWVAIEREGETIQQFALPRLRKVVEGSDPGGVTALVEWAGGGGFRSLSVAPSMFEADGGLVFLTEGLSDGKLAESTAAQLGFEYEVSPPFVGRKGRTRLAVVDGVVNDAVIRLIVSALAEGERVVVCGTGIDTDARAVLRELRPGSRLRKIPAALLDEYRTSRQLRLELATVGDPASKSDGEEVTG
ncbi:MAG: DNA methyltransferase [Candidatus Limnocylindrales bacterium]